MEAQRAEASGSDNERRHAKGEIDGRLALLNERIATAHVVEPPAKAGKEVRFGSTVIFAHQPGRSVGKQLTITIVGVDEVNIKHGLIAFTAPIAHALLGKRKGRVATLQLGSELEKVKVLLVA